MWRKILSPFREFGLYAGAVYIIDNILNRLSTDIKLYLYEFLIQPIPEKDLIPAKLVNDVQLREITQADEEINMMPARKDIIKSRYEQDAVCLGVYQKDKFIGYIWFSFNTYDEDEVRCTFILNPPEITVFDFDLYIFPEYRGLGFLTVWNTANQYLRNNGIKYSYSRLTRFNLSSRKAHQHLGARCIGRAMFLKMWQLEIMFTDIYPYLHFTLSKSSRVRIKLNPQLG